jgi:hypothetical protein
MDPTAFHTIIQLIRNGTFGLDDVEEIAERLDEEGEADAAHAVRATLIEASAPTIRESEAEFRRSLIKLVPQADGGNGTS